jgi:hypothetical protein
LASWLSRYMMYVLNSGSSRGSIKHSGDIGTSSHSQRRVTLFLSRCPRRQPTVSFGEYSFLFSLGIDHHNGPAGCSSCLSACPPPLPSCLPPFSLREVRALVPAVLDFDSPAPPLALSLRTSSSSLQRKKSTQSASRARLPLTELKKRAAALIVQRRRHPATTTQLSCHAIWMEAVAATRFSRLTSLRRSTSAVSQFSRATPSPVPLPWPFLILACIPASVRIALRIRLLVRRRVIARTSASPITSTFSD